MELKTIIIIKIVKQILMFFYNHFINNNNLFGNFHITSWDFLRDES